MRIIADFHNHSKYSRATSPRCDLEGNSKWAKIKGIDVLSTGDFTHPKWIEELKKDLEDLGNGLYRYNNTKFILSAEIAIFYSRGGKSKRMHVIMLSPSLEISEQINEMLSTYGNIAYDGRPILKLDPKELMDRLKSISKNIFVILAHIWTPWFSLFGSRSGVNSIEEALEERVDFLGALETGLSSDPLMNWMLSSLDKYSLVSNSDAHSPEKLGREANVFELEEISYRSIINAIKTKKGFVKTFEFFPEEGKYHYDGHRKCGVVLHPKKSLEGENKCPKCKKELTVGVMQRVYELADRDHGFKPENAVPFQHIVPLPTVLSKVLNKGENTKIVKEEYFKLIKYFGDEFSVYEADTEQLKLATSKNIANSIGLVNEGKIHWIPGHDGVFGELKLDIKDGEKQKNLSEF